MSFHRSARSYHKILGYPLTDSVAKVVGVHLEQEVLEDVNGMVRDLELDDALTGILIETHHSCVYLNATCLLLVALLGLLNNRFERSAYKSRVDRRSSARRCRSWHYVIKEVDWLALGGRSWVIKDVENATISCS